MGKVQSKLILPETYVKEHKAGMVTVFQISLEKVINENQWRKEPYFINYHDCDDKFYTNFVHSSMKAYDIMPPFMARQIVFWVDNQKGFKEWLWTINDDNKIFFNINGVSHAKKSGALVPKKHEAAAGL